MCTFTTTCSRLFLDLYSLEYFLRVRKNILLLLGHLYLDTGYWILTSSELHQRAVNSQHRVKASLSSAITISQLLSQKRQEILRQRGDKTRVRSGDSCQVNGPTQKYEFLLQSLKVYILFTQSQSGNIVTRSH